MIKFTDMIIDVGQIIMSTVHAYGTYFLSLFAAGFPRFSDLLRLLELLDPEELLLEDPERLDAEELLPEPLPLPLDELPEEPFLVFRLTGDRPREPFSPRLGLGLSERALST